jgi:RNA polymerase sigma factor (sigma-70 family)
MNDEKILAALKAGDYSKAAEKLYRYFPVVQKLVVNNQGGKREAEEIFQEAVIMIIKNLESNDYVLKSRLNTQLYGVCRFLWNAALDTKNSVGANAPEKKTILLKNTESEHYHKAEADHRIARLAFKKLDSRCRQLLLLFYFDNKSLRDVSLILSFSSEKAAKSRKYHCLEIAKKNLSALKLMAHE